MSAGCTARVQIGLFVSAGNGWPHNALEYHQLMPISSHFRVCKALLVMSLPHASSAMVGISTQTFTFLPLYSGRHYTAVNFWIHTANYKPSKEPR